MISLDTLLARLDGVKKSSGGYVARCPGHEDRHQSLSITQAKEGHILLKCHAGCAFEHVVEALRLEVSELLPDRERQAPEHATIVATYDYVDERGTLLYQVCRMDPKSFRQRRPAESGGWDWKLGDVRRIPYRLPQVMAAAMAGRRIFIVEGEKDVHTLETWDLIATTNAGGAGKWLEEFAEYLEDGHVIILPDNDETGLAHARQVKASLEGKVKSVRILQLPGLPEKGDVTDWVRAGGTKEDLKRMVQAPAEVPGVTKMSAVIKDLSRYKTEAMPPGINYPWSVMNRRTRGIRPGWFVIWAGYPSSGKTAMAMEVGFSAAKNNKTVLFNSLEMSKQELGIRIVQRWGLNTERLYNNRVNDEDRDAFDIAACLPEYEHIQLCKERTISGLKERMLDAKPDLVIVDYIGLMDMGHSDTQEGTARISRELTALAQSCSIPVAALSQLSRPPDKDKIHIPTMHDLRGSGVLECDADHVIIVYRDESKDDEEGHADESDGRFIIAKSRHARAGKPIPFVFDGARMEFRLKNTAKDRAEEQGWSVYDGGEGQG